MAILLFKISLNLNLMFWNLSGKTLILAHPKFKKNMKKPLKLFLICISLLISQLTCSQNWQSLEEGEVLSINNMELSFITSYIKETNGQDVYQITATLNNLRGDNLVLFQRAEYTFTKVPQNAWIHFRFTNATGKGLSAREGYIYPNPISMQFPYKCNPEDKKPTWESRIIGVGLYEGEYKTEEWRVRVNKGEKLKVMVFNKF